MRLKVMTLNLLYAGATNPAGSWSARLPLVVSVLSSGADIITLQEATTPQIHDLQAALPDFTVVTGPESGQTRLPRVLHRGSRHGEHCVILYRTERFEALELSAFWLSHRPHIPGSILVGTWLPRVVNWVRLKERATRKILTVYNAHLDFLPWAPLRSARILRQMLDLYWDGNLQLLMGDFNASPGSKAYAHLGTQLKPDAHPSLIDARQVARERVGPEGTYHGGTGRVRWMGRLDRILFRPALSVARVTTVTHHQGRIYPSDHYPVLVEFEELGEHRAP
ncbi:endonuclease/exonuclease/phosphatase family protein [Armatimonas sp.]|uniref:endonuclease/exonuclease/phosphatase family protein n=1 Tax=Armatimonas sp. TaxID=1872638 RepID=UPI00286BE8C7|nr:endonuclease/exonuclease/phosphatase family protein [Armatimonas sp.]